MPVFSAEIAKHGVEHHIISPGLLVSTEARQMDVVKLVIAREEFAMMERMGTVHCSNTPGPPSYIWFLKKDGGGTLRCF